MADGARSVIVEDVMTTSVVTATPETGFQDLVATMAEHHVSGVPVVDGGGRIVGIVSEADLLREGSEDRRRTRALDWFLQPARTEDARTRQHDAGAIMTTPVVTVQPHTSIWEAIRKLREAGVKRLPVVDGEGQLLGIVSRVDLLSAFIRTDDEIAEQIRGIVAKILVTELREVNVGVNAGRVTFTGSIDFVSQRDVLLDVVAHIPGVLQIEDRLEIAPEGKRADPFVPIQPPGADAGPRMAL
jgi:CBS domain-containing protein